MSKSPYLTDNRLADVIAAIQFMSMNERSSLDPADWAEGISGDRMKAGSGGAYSTNTPNFFEDHPATKISTL